LTVAAAAGADADAAVGALVDGEVSSDGADLGTGGVGGVDSSSLLVSFVFSDTTVAAAADAAAGALVGVRMSSDHAVSSSKGARGVGSTLLGLIPVETNEASVVPSGVLSMVLVSLVGLLVGVAMVGLTKISFFIVGKGCCAHPPSWDCFASS
jgi:hypothetical protein